MSIILSDVRTASHTHPVVGTDIVHCEINFTFAAVGPSVLIWNLLLVFTLQEKINQLTNCTLFITGELFHRTAGQWEKVMV